MTELVNINFAEAGFSEREAADCRLYVLKIAAHTKLAVLDAGSRLQVLQEWDGQPGERINEFLQWHYMQRIVLLPHHQLQFIPNDLYDEGQTALYGRLLDHTAERSALVYNFKYIPAKFLYTVTDPSSHMAFPSEADELIPAAAAWIESMALMSAAEETLLGLQLYADNADFVYFVAGQLQFYNRFPKADADEFNYFLLNLMNEFNLDTAQTAVVLAGDILPGDENYERISKYFKNIRMAPVAGLLQTDREVVLDQGHRLLNLFGTTLCVS